MAFKKILLSLLIPCLLMTSNTSESGIIKNSGKYAVGSAVLAGSALYISNIKKMMRFADHPEEANPFFEKNPDRKFAILENIKKVLNNPRTEDEYNKYKKLADTINIHNIPPYIPPAEAATNIHDRPIEEVNGNGVIATPYDNFPNDMNIIFTPTYESFDVGTQFPNQDIKNWDEYILASRASEELEKNMNIVYGIYKPKDYEAHHIVGWNENRYRHAADLRKLLYNNNIDINDADNGVYLPSYRNKTSGNGEAFHREVHTQMYYDNLNLLLTQPNIINNEGEMRKVLKTVANELKNNTFRYK